MARHLPEISVAYVAELATRWERRDHAILQRINRREQLYHCDWQIERQPGVEYVPEMRPRIMADRAMDKLCSQPPLLKVLDDDQEVLEDPSDQELEADAESTDPLARERQLAEQTARSYANQAEEIEATMSGLWQKIQMDQRVNLTRLIARSCVVTAYAVGRVTYLMPDEAYDGEVPLRVQILDRRFYHDTPGPGGGKPVEVIYARRDKAAVLRAEGWEVQFEADDEDTIRLIDYWRKERVVVRGGDPDEPDDWQTVVWHAIVLDDQAATMSPHDQPRRRSPKGQPNTVYGNFAKPPTDMTAATDGLLTDIPYVMRKCRPTPTVPTGATSSLGWSARDYEALEAQSFIEIYDEIWESMCKVTSWRAQQAALAVRPPSVAKTENARAVDLVTDIPNAQNTLKINESVEFLVNPQAAKEIGLLDQDLKGASDLATFSAASVGTGQNQASGVMTERLQEAGAQSLIATKETAEGIHDDLLSLLGMMARAYLTGRSYRLPGYRRAVRADFSMLTGQEIYQVKLPAMSRLELMQSLAAAKALTEPDPVSGYPFVSRETGWDIGGLPYPALENRKVKRQKIEDADWNLEVARAKLYQQNKDAKALMDMAGVAPPGAVPPGAPPAAAPGQPGAPAGVLPNGHPVYPRENINWKDIPPEAQAAMLRQVGLPPAPGMGTSMGAPEPWQPRILGGPRPGVQPGRPPVAAAPAPAAWEPTPTAQIPSFHPNGPQGGAGPIPAVGAPQGMEPPRPPGLLARIAAPVVNRMSTMFRSGSR